MRIGTKSSSNQNMWLTLAVCLAIPLLGGFIIGAIISPEVLIYQTLVKPPLSPPSYLFGIVWTILYLMIGFASYIVACRSKTRDRDISLKVYAWQLILNFIWSILFFNFHLYGLAAVEIILMWISIIVTMYFFNRVSRYAFYLMIPYILWVSFASYLNIAVAILN